MEILSIANRYSDSNPVADTVHRLQDFGLERHYVESGDICVEPGCLM